MTLIFNPPSLPITDEGDEIVGGTNGVPIRLPVGSVGQKATRRYGESRRSWNNVPYLDALDWRDAANDGADYSLAVNRAISLGMAAMGGPCEIILPPRAEAYLETITAASNVTLRGGGSNTELVKSDTGNLIGVYGASGTYGVDVALTGDAFAGQQSVVLPTGAGAGFSRGDLIGFRSEANVYDLTNAGEKGRTRDIRIVTQVSGDIVYLDLPLIFPFLVADSAVFFTLDPIRGFALEDFKVTNIEPIVDAQGYTLQVKGFRDLRIANVEIEDGGGGYQLTDVIGADLDGLRIDRLRHGHDPSAGGTSDALAALGYGIDLIGSTSLINVRGINGTGTRHLVTTGPFNVAGTPVKHYGGPRNCVISDGIAQGGGTGLAQFDTHPYGSFITYDNCEAWGAGPGYPGFQARSPDTTLQNCRGFYNGRHGVRGDVVAPRLRILGGEYAWNGLAEETSLPGLTLAGLDTLVKGVLVHHNGWYGIVTYDGAAVEDCSIFDNGQAPLATTVAGIQDVSTTVPARFLRNYIPFGGKQGYGIFTLGAGSVADGNYLPGNYAGQNALRTPNAAAIIGRNLTSIAPYATVGNVAKTLTSRSSEPDQVWNTPLTADRAVTLSTTGAFKGDKFHVVRSTAATGAFNLNVGTGPLKALAAGQWCDVEYDGTNWVLIGFGSL